MIKKEPAAETKSVKFEEALKRLEKIVEKLETGDVPLDDSLSLYEEGISLYRHCSSKLEEAKKRVEILTKKGGSEKLQAVPFNAEKLSENEEGDESNQKQIPF